MQPDLAALQWVLAWQDVMLKHLMVALFEGSFFPSWHGVLRHWLSGSPNFDEVTSWYIGWKVRNRTCSSPVCTVFPAALVSVQRSAWQLCMVCRFRAACMSSTSVKMGMLGGGGGVRGGIQELQSKAPCCTFDEPVHGSLKYGMVLPD